MQPGRKIITSNRKASFNYNLLQTFDAGIALMGSEIKSIRDNRINIQDGFVQERNGELWLHNVHINPYARAHHFGHSDPTRPRKLLLHRKEIAHIVSRVRERGVTIVPTSVFLERGRAKVTIALAVGKKLYDKRADIAKRDSERQIQRALKEQE